LGRAAKLVAVYLKAMVVMGGDPETSLARVAHPPIDRILLQNLARAEELDSPHQRAWGGTNWTQLSEDAYYELIEQLCSCLEADEPMWHLERYWTVTR
jgi:hypothetical protein